MEPRPFVLAARQRDLDRAATARYPLLHERKCQRLLQSPHGFFRGSARLFYEILAARPDLACGPPGDGWIVGDMHVENVGAYRTDADHVVFDLNDFDDASLGPRRLDALRLATSVLLAGRSFRSTGAEAIALAEAAMHACGEAASGAPPPASLPAPITAMMARAGNRTQRALLDDRAPEGRDGRRRFVRGDRYFEVPDALAPRVPDLVARYIAALGPRAPAHAATWQVEDAAMRIAGTGSLGVTRLAILVRDRSGGARVIELKEARPTALGAFLPPPAQPFSTDANRVVAAAFALTSEPPRQLTSVTDVDASYTARKLFPQEDKLNLDALRVGPKLDAVVRTIGGLVGAAHARASAADPATPSFSPWTAADIAALLDRAVEMAGLFEAIYLAYARG